MSTLILILSTLIIWISMNSNTNTEEGAKHKHTTVYLMFTTTQRLSVYIIDYPHETISTIPIKTTTMSSSWSLLFPTLIPIWIWKKHIYTYLNIMVLACDKHWSCYCLLVGEGIIVRVSLINLGYYNYELTMMSKRAWWSGTDFLYLTDLFVNPHPPGVSGIGLSCVRVPGSTDKPK